MGKTGKKRTNLEIEANLIQIHEWILEGISTKEMERSIVENGWCSSTRHAWNLIKKAKDRWVEEQSVDLREQRAVKVRQLESYRDSLLAKYNANPTPQGLSAITRTETTIIKLQGLNAPTKVEVTGANGGPVQVALVAKIDYTKLSTSALREIIAARLPPPNE